MRFGLRLLHPRDDRKSHLEELYERYEESSRAHTSREAERSRQLVKQKHEVLEVVLQKLRGESALQQKYLARRKSTGLWTQESASTWRAGASSSGTMT